MAFLHPILAVALGPCLLAVAQTASPRPAALPPATTNICLLRNGLPTGHAAFTLTSTGAAVRLTRKTGADGCVTFNTGPGTFQLSTSLRSPTIAVPVSLGRVPQDIELNLEAAEHPSLGVTTDQPSELVSFRAVLEEAPASGATVRIFTDEGLTWSCTTGEDGRCSLDLPPLALQMSARLNRRSIRRLVTIDHAGSEILLEFDRAQVEHSAKKRK